MREGIGKADGSLTACSDNVSTTNGPVFNLFNIIISTFIKLLFAYKNKQIKIVKAYFRKKGKNRYADI